MRIVSVPHIKHGQRVKPKQALKFLSDARAWLKYANRTINVLKFSGRSENYIMQKARIIEEGLDTIERQFEWIKDHGVQNGKVNQLLRFLGQTRERLEGLIEVRR